MDFETRLAACHVDVVRLRDREKSYNPMDATQRRELAPAFPWDAFFEGTGAPSAATEVVSIGQPEFVSAAAELLAGQDLAVLRTWLALHGVSAYAPTCPPIWSRPTSTSAGGCSAAPRSCVSAGSGAWASSRARSASRWAGSTWPGTSRRRTRNAWSRWSTPSRTPTATPSPPGTG